jgi:mRNA-degrading endonuclease RelE of RelBE toxin-antitoxin system
LPGMIQYAVGNWRILYAIDREDHVVAIHRVCARSELYRRTHQS